MNIKVFIIVFILTIIFLNAYGKEEASERIKARLGEVLEISKIIVEEDEYLRNSDLKSVRKVDFSRTSDTSSVLTLSPIKVKIHTNITSPIYIKADFVELTHNNNLYSFNKKDLSFLPNKIVINNPYDEVISGDFTPSLDITEDVVSGIYIGKVVFTLGAI